MLILQLVILTAILSGCGGASSVRHMPQFGSSTTNWQPSNQSPQNIALLLPASDPLAVYANAIRNGFFTAYYHQKNMSGYSPTIHTYNTSLKNIQTVYQTAVAAGADIIVGPLDKSDVKTLAADSTSTVPILALNTTPSNLVVKNTALYEFGLSPSDEAQQAAMRAHADHRQNIIILAPNSAWGQRLVNTFSSTFQRGGGNIVATQYYGDFASLSTDIADVLQISSQTNTEKKLQREFRTELRYLPQRRQDFDSIFLVASPRMAQQIQPLLRYNFVTDIPIYSVSEVYVTADHDLDGIQFCDMPWVLAPTQMSSSLQTIQQNIQTLWPNRYSEFAKFYAMGVDAFDLAATLKQMQENPQSGLPAATGILYVTPQHYVYRQLLWAKITDGQPKILQ